MNCQFPLMVRFEPEKMVVTFGAFDMYSEVAMLNGMYIIHM